MNDDEIKEILDKFDKVLKNYELDKKFGQMSVDSIYHLFPSEMVAIKDYITNLQQENERLKELCDKYEEEHSNEFQCWKRDRKELLDKRARIEKAVGYIKEQYKWIEESDKRWQPVLDNKKLLNILNGRSDE